MEIHYVPHSQDIKGVIKQINYESENAKIAIERLIASLDQFSLNKPFKDTLRKRTEADIQRLQYTVITIEECAKTLTNDLKAFIMDEY